MLAMAGHRFVQSKDARGTEAPQEAAGAAACALPARAQVGRLRAAVARIEDRLPGGPPDEVSRPLHTIPFGVAPVDAALGGGLAAGTLHEVRAETALDLPGAAGFALAAAGLLTGFGGHVFWIAPRQARHEAGAFYGPGLGAFGLDGARMVRVLVRDEGEALWAAGEVARAGAGVCLIELRGNPAAAGLAFSRRLALRARASGMTAILLRQSGGAQASAATTRWRVAPAPSRDEAKEWGEGQRSWVGPPAWKVTLEKCRGGRPGEWTLEWRNDDHLFALYCDGEDAVRCRRHAAGTPLPGGEPALHRDRPDRAAALGGRLALGRAS
jgi:protein ImuA